MDPDRQDAGRRAGFFTSILLNFKVCLRKEVHYKSTETVNNTDYKKAIMPTVLRFFTFS